MQLWVFQDNTRLLLTFTSVHISASNISWESIPGPQLTTLICITSQNLNIEVVAQLFSLFLSLYVSRLQVFSMQLYGKMPCTECGVWFCCPLSCFVVQVESRDTLNSISLKFDTTPNELVQLNKLFSRAVVPGQVWTTVHALTDIFSCNTSSLSFSNLSPAHSHKQLNLNKATFDS